MKAKRVKFVLNENISADFYRIKRELHCTEAQAARYLVEKGLEVIASSSIPNIVAGGLKAVKSR